MRMAVWSARMLAVVGVSAALAACSPGGAATGSAPTAPVEQPNLQATVDAKVAQADLQATVEAQVQATLAARAGNAPAAATSAPVVATPTAAQPTPKEIGKDSLPPTAVATTPAQPSTANQNSPLLLAVSTNGSISTLNDQGWTVPALNDNQPNSCGVDSRPGIDATGTFWLSCGRVLESPDGTSWTPSEQRLGSVVFSSDGRAVSMDMEKIQLLENGQWRSFDLSATGEQQFPYRTATFGPDGTVWVAGYNSKGSQLISYNNGAWKTYGTAGDDFMSTIFATSKGELIGATSYLYHWDGTKFTEVMPRETLVKAVGQGGGANIVRLAEAPNGDILGATEAGIVVWSGGDSIDLIDQQDGLPSNDVRDIAFDANGNLWAATSYGVAVRVNNQWQVALPSTSGIAESDIVSLVVRGAPTMPPPAAQPRTTSISGKITRDDTPVANSRVELCIRVGVFTNNSPTHAYCDNLPFSMETKTDAQGNYSFADVPLGNYAIIVTDGDQFVIPTELGIKALVPNQPVVFDENYG